MFMYFHNRPTAQKEHYNNLVWKLQVIPSCVLEKNPTWLDAPALHVQPQHRISHEYCCLHSGTWLKMKVN